MWRNFCCFHGGAESEVSRGDPAPPSHKALGNWKGTSWLTGKELAGYSLTTDQSVVDSAFQNYLEKKVHYLKNLL